MIRLAIAAFVSAALSTPVLAEEASVPASAKQLTGKEIPTFLDGKKFDIVIYDADAPITATTNWDWKKKKVSGDFVYKGKTGHFENDWKIKGDTSCAEKDPKGKWICQKVFVDGDVMYEVNAKGAVHAISKPAG